MKEKRKFLTKDGRKIAARMGTAGESVRHIWKTMVQIPIFAWRKREFFLH